MEPLAGDEVLKLPQIDVEIPVDAIYAGVSFAQGDDKDARR
jgi:hypothetical protein